MFDPLMEQPKLRFDDPLGCDDITTDIAFRNLRAIAYRTQHTQPNLRERQSPEEQFIIGRIVADFDDLPDESVVSGFDLCTVERIGNR